MARRTNTRMIFSWHRPVIAVLIAMTTAVPAVSQTTQVGFPSLLPATRAMLNYVGLSVDGYVYRKIAQAVKPDAPKLSELVSMYEGHLTQRSVSAILLPLLPKVNDLHDPKSQAILLAIDHLAPWLKTTKSNRERLSKYGLHFHPYVNGGWLYDHDLLWRAWKLAPDSDLGKDAFLLLLERGFDPSLNCLFGPDNFLRMIHYGEPWLHKHAGDPRVIFVKFMLARAYHTWWVVGHDKVPTDKKYIPGSDTAYHKAVTDYQQVMQMLAALPPGNYGDYSPLISEMQDAAKTELQRLENKQFDFTAFYCVPGA
ncbi:MAG TPA: hypothetical protein VFX47_02890 [Gammaproteobacteria bacterium]|nr:hypothetical protein [Gammaproteobacteria bacterium]